MSGREHPADRLASLGFVETYHGIGGAEFIGHVRGTGADVKIHVDHVNAGPDYADEEEMWETVVYEVDDLFGAQTGRLSLGTYSSERAAIAAAVDWVIANEHDPGNLRGFFG